MVEGVVGDLAGCHDRGNERKESVVDAVDEPAEPVVTVVEGRDGKDAVAPAGHMPAPLATKSF